MERFLQEFMQQDGTPIARSSSECMQYLQMQGYTVQQSRGIIGRAVANGWICCLSETDRGKIYV